jgi:hypothetical protein
VSPEGVSNGQQPGNEFAAQQPAASSLAAPGSHFIPGFVRRRPIRAVLLAAAVFAIPYSLARHQGGESAQRIAPASAPAPAAPAGLSNALPPNSLPPGPVAIEHVPGNGSSAPSWNPPIGMDRSNAALDQLTMDFSSRPHSGPQQPAPDHQASAPKEPATGPRTESARPASTSQTPDQRSGFQAGARVTSADAAQPAPAPGPAQAPAEAAPVEAPAAAAPPAVNAPADAPATPRVAKASPLNEINEYLWSVYQRSTTKRDSSGDFTWKDEAAAARLGVMTKQYVIGGMDRDFRELLYNLGHAMDAASLHWTILSGFRDDYRQGLAAGYKAHVGNSFHGGSRATGGYGHGCAADIEAVTGDDSAVWKFVDQHGEKFGIFRPMKQIDPAHIQPFGEWHDVAFNLRGKREPGQGSFVTASVDRTDGEKVTRLVDTRSNVTEAQFDCVRSHRGGFHTASLSHRQRFTMGGRMHRAVLLHSGRMHRFGRRRMVVDTGSAHRRADAETATVLVSDTTSAEKRAKAEASDTNRRDARRNKVADTGRSGKRSGKEAALNTDGDKRNAKARDDNGPKVADDGKRSQKRAAAENAKGQAKSSQTKSATAKNGVHVADQPDASGKNGKKL